MAKNQFSETRRQVLKSLALSPLALSEAGLIAGCGASEIQNDTIADLHRLFVDPPVGARPFFRWWWNGNRVDRVEITRQLQMMHAAGIGGVEVNPVAMPEQVLAPQGDELIWLSDQWIDMLLHTIDEARRLGMEVDLIVGTGWPFGGEFLDPDETIQGVKILSVDLQGPLDQYTLRLPEPDGINRMRITGVVLWPFGAGSGADAVHIGGSFEPGAQMQIDVPSGRYRLYVLYWQDRFRTVMHGAPGGAGPVLDHFNRAAVEKYLNRISGRIAPRLGGSLGNGLRSMFCDSIELEGANWTGDLPLEFERRKGYDLLPLLVLVLDPNPAVSDELADVVHRTRYDYADVLAGLFAERFIEPFHQWCHEQGVLSRYQAYGHPWLYTDLLEGYRIPDIPEGDQWLYNDGWQPYADVDRIRYAIWNKYAASAGHIFGRRIVSTEAMTNTSGVFRASLDYIKQAGDLNLAMGINHQVLHGFNYSPPEAGFPGWIRYGCYFSEHNPWWPFFSRWTEYTARVSALMQASVPAGDLAIIGPTADIWSHHGLDRNPFNLQPWYLHAIWQAFNHHGCSTDFINWRILAEAEPDGARIRCGEMSFGALLVCDVQRMHPEAARRLADLCVRGARVVFLGRLPDRAPGRDPDKKRDLETRKWIAEAMAKGALLHESPPEELQRDQQLLCDWTGDLMKKHELRSGLILEPADAGIFHHRRRAGSGELIFIANTCRDRSLEVNLHLEHKPKAIWRWDPESGQRYAFNTVGGVLRGLHLDPLESALLLSDRAAGTVAKPETESGGGHELDLPPDGPWQLELKPILGQAQELQLEELADLSGMEQTAGFSGVAIYRNTITIPEVGAGAMIDLGTVGDIAEVWIGGHPLGLRWWGKKTFRLPAGLKPGQHTLEVSVTTTLINAMLQRPDDPVAAYWIERSGNRAPAVTGLVGPLKILW